MKNDKYPIGLSYRSEFTYDLLQNKDHVDILEFMLEDYLGCSQAKKDSLKLLAGVFPVSFHGVSLGLVSQESVSVSKLKKISKLLNEFNQASWSEHLCFVRSRNIEIGHLAAPPWNKSSVAGAIKNINLIQKYVGKLPLFENIATLVRPPGSQLTEQEFVSEILNETGAGLLLDLHNLYANAINFGIDPVEYLLAFPLERVKEVHLSGGKEIFEPNSVSKTRILDDHLHDVPKVVFDLLKILGQKCQQGFSVIIERDGNHPHFSTQIEQIQMARYSVSQGQDSLDKDVRKGLYDDVRI